MQSNMRLEAERLLPQFARVWLRSSAQCCHKVCYRCYLTNCNWVAFCSSPVSAQFSNLDLPSYAFLPVADHDTVKAATVLQLGTYGTINHALISTDLRRTGRCRYARYGTEKRLSLAYPTDRALTKSKHTPNDKVSHDYCTPYSTTVHTYHTQWNSIKLRFGSIISLIYCSPCWHLSRSPPPNPPPSVPILKSVSRMALPDPS